MLYYLSMARLEIITYPNPLLNEKAAEVKDFDGRLNQLIDDMTQTMYEGNGIGLAAPQVSILQRVIVVDVSPEAKDPRHFVNPEIIERSGKVTFEEGCLSVPDYRDTVTRSACITVRAQDRSGTHFELQADGLLAICIQHEMDHLEGILFVDRISRLKRELFRRWFKKRTRLETEA